MINTGDCDSGGVVMAMEKDNTKADWRLTNQDKFFRNAKLIFSKYTTKSERWNHDHCEFCFETFCESSFNIKDSIDEGYCTLDSYHWICETCYEDFKEMFNWTIVKKL